MDLNDTPEQASYRQEVRAWLEANKKQAPPRSGSSEDKEYVDARRAWQRQLAEAGAVTLRVADTYPPERAGETHQRLEAGGTRGRLVIEF